MGRDRERERAREREKHKQPQIQNGHTDRQADNRQADK